MIAGISDRSAGAMNILLVVRHSGVVSRFGSLHNQRADIKKGKGQADDGTARHEPALCSACVTAESTATRRALFSRGSMGARSGRQRLPLDRRVPSLVEMCGADTQGCVPLASRSVASVPLP